MKYRKKPVVIEAIQWTGNNLEDINAFIGKMCVFKWTEKELTIFTLEGDMKANIGDYIIKGVKGEFYPCKPDIFNETYEKITDDEQEETGLAFADQSGLAPAT